MEIKSIAPVYIKALEDKQEENKKSIYDIDIKVKKSVATSLHQNRNEGVSDRCGNSQAACTYKQDGCEIGTSGICTSASDCC